MSEYPADENSVNGRRGGNGGPLLVTFLVVAVIVAAIGIFMRMHDASALAKKTEKTAVPTVVVIQAAAGPSTEDIALPSNVQAWHEAPIYARTSGYLKLWVTDIGTPVKQGDLIAQIEAPEVDAQLRQAEADLQTAQANNRIAQITAERWTNLLKTNAVSKQDADSRTAAAAATAATESSAEANVRRLQDLVSFERIVAPFDGIITARNTDNGALINPGSSTGNGPELFHIAETDKLRVYAQVPELDVPAVKPDMVADLQEPELPGQNFAAKLIHMADALDPTTRTLEIELEVDNKDSKLLPGSYAYLHLKLPSSGQPVRLPVNTLLFRAQGMQVATVDDDDKAQLKSVVIGRDYGKEVEITSGVNPGETIIVNPSDSLQSGQEVRIENPDDNDDSQDSDKKTQNGKEDVKNSGKTDDGTNKDDHENASKDGDTNDKDSSKDSGKPNESDQKQ